MVEISPYPAHTSDIKGPRYKGLYIGNAMKIYGRLKIIYFRVKS